MAGHTKDAMPSDPPNTAFADATSATTDRTSRRRLLLQCAAGSLAPLWASVASAQQGGNVITLPSISAATETPEKLPSPADGPSRRIGFAIVGLGHLTLERLMPAFGQSKHCKPVALVSGDRDKALKLARQFDIRDDAVYDYRNFDRIAQNPEVEVVYIVLPNSMHAEFTVRAARAGKHVLCEKPMAVSASECQQMIDACRTADRKLMVAYRSQYEPMNRAIRKMVVDKQLGMLKEFISTNSQNMGDPNHWRLKKALAGGGAMPDIGLYCLNGARFLSGEEPTEVMAWTDSTPGDVRFREVEENVHFMLRFPSGFRATCHASYGAHKSQMLRLMGSDGWAELDPGYAYEGNRMRYARKVGDRVVVSEPQIPQKDQFALEMDHIAECVRNNVTPHTPGEEGLQDHRIMEAIYASARANGKAMPLAQPSSSPRGPEPAAGD